MGKKSEPLNLNVVNPRLELEENLRSIEANLQGSGPHSPQSEKAQSRLFKSGHGPVGRPTWKRKRCLP